MEFRLLGPVGVTRAGRPLWLGGRRERTMLAVLVLAAGRVVPTHRLIDVAWGDTPPATARRQVHSAMSALRRALGERLVTRDPGYLLVARSGEVDAQVFDDRVAEARAARGTAEAADGLRAALRLWHGPALGGVTGLAPDAARLEEQRLAVLAERVDLDLAAGRHVDLVGELSALIGEHPLTERFRAQLMLALYRSGRQAEALRVFQETRRVLAEDLGLEPPGELCRLERAILAADPALDLCSETADTDCRNHGHTLSKPRTRAVDTADTPDLLPADIADFTGRDEQVRALCSALAGDGGRQASGGGRAVVVSAVAGQGGVGKTTLAVNVAHRLRPAFGDGRLYVDLHGAGRAPADPAEVLARFLRALGMDGPAIPDGLDERAELYRQRLAGRHVLVVLDNARDEAQVNPLLPGSPTTAVLVTSRSRLGALAGADLVELDVFEPEQALRLLGSVVGTARVAAEPAAAVELARLCGHLPLAVRIAAAKLAARPHRRIADLVERLADEHCRLDELAHGGLAMRASVGLSYQGLDQRARRLLRHLGLLAAPEFAGWVAAAVLDTTPAEADELVERLVDARLLQVSGPHRYRFHDLVRVFAHERADAEDTAGERRAALGRALGGWLALAERAHRITYGGDYVIIHGSAPRRLPDGHDELLADPLGWLETERLAIVAAVRQAAELDADEFAWDLAQSSVTLFAIRWYLDDWLVCNRHAMAATRRAGNRRGEAAILCGFGCWHEAHGRYRHALRCFTRASAIFDGLGERHGHGLAQAYVSHIARRLGRFELALASADRARSASREVGDRAAEASALRSTAQTHKALGRTELVQAPLDEALAMLAATGNLRDQAQVLHEVGELHLRRGALDHAEPAFGRVLAITRELGDRIGEAFALQGLGVCLSRRGRPDEAETRLTEALRLARDTGIRFIEGRVLVALGEVAQAQGRPARAVARLRAAVEVSVELGSPLWQARALHRLGSAYRDGGDPAAAGAAWQRSLALFRELGSAEAGQVVQSLAALASLAHVAGLRPPAARAAAFERECAAAWS